jgi:hypothetical protein
VQRLIVAEQLHVVRAAVEDETLEHPAAVERHLSALRPRARAGPQRAQEAHHVR